MYALKTVQKIAAGAAAIALVASLLPMAVSAAGGPSVVLSSSAPMAPTTTGDNPIPVSATVSTSTVDFNAGDVSVQNGVVSNFAGSGTSYTFDVVPSNPNDTDATHRLITVQVNDNAFDGNNVSNQLQFQYDSTAASSTGSGDTDTNVPVITIVGPNGTTTNNAVVTTPDAATPAAVAFTFTVDDASSTTMCSIVGQTDADSFFSCGSPQNYTLPLGAYRFVVKATNNVGTASSSVDFSVATSTSNATTSTATVSIIDPSPANGSTVGATTTLNYYFTASSGATTMCSFMDTSGTSTTPFSCASPVTGLGVTPGQSYLFSVTATLGSSTATDSRTVTVSTTTLNDTDTNVPVITLTSGPTDGSTVTNGSVSFGFTVDDASSTVMCSNVDQSTVNSFSGCTSPQSYSLANGSYRFVVQAANNAGTASSTVNFTVSIPTSSGSGGGGGSSSPAPSGGGDGAGNNGGSGVPTGHAIIPGGSASTGGNAVIPTPPAPVTTTQTSSGSGSTVPVPVVSQSSGGSALVGNNAPSTVTPGIPNTGSVTSTSPDQTLNTGSSSLAAAAATANTGGGIPVWVWIVLAGIVLIGIGIWALRQPA